jgi:hypothetical protein
MYHNSGHNGVDQAVGSLTMSMGPLVMTHAFHVHACLQLLTHEDAVTTSDACKLAEQHTDLIKAQTGGSHQHNPTSLHGALLGDV